jgi:hypothetical protein
MIPITNCHGVPVGYVEDEIFYTERRAEHFFRIFNGYAVSIDVLIKARIAVLRTTAPVIDAEAKEE